MMKRDPPKLRKTDPQHIENKKTERINRIQIKDNATGRKPSGQMSRAPTKENATREQPSDQIKCIQTKDDSTPGAFYQEDIDQAYRWRYARYKVLSAWKDTKDKKTLELRALWIENQRLKKEMLDSELVKQVNELHCRINRLQDAVNGDSASEDLLSCLPHMLNELNGSLEARSHFCPVTPSNRSALETTELVKEALQLFLLKNTCPEIAACQCK